MSEEELSSAYDEFAVLLSNYSVREDSVIKKLRELYHTEIELMALLQLLLQHPHGLLKVYLDKTYNLIKAEIKLTHLLLHHPGVFHPKTENLLASPSLERFPY